MNPHDSPGGKPPLRAHQEGDIAWWQEQGRGLLANEPGLGKSRSAIEGAPPGDVLVVAPSMVIESGVWEDEVALWGRPDTEYFIAPYSMLNKRVDGRPVKALRPDLRRRWDAVVIDEAHYAKGRRTLWTWAAHELAGRSDRFVAMTGTPIPNWSHELFTVLRMIWIDQSTRGQTYGSFWRWAERWFDCTPTRHSAGNPVAGRLLGCSNACEARPASEPCEHYLAFAQANLGRRWRRMLRDECLDLPPLDIQDVATPLGKDARHIYRDLAKHFTTTIDGKEIMTWTHGAKQVAIDRVTTSPWLLNPVGEPRGGKLDQLRFDLEGRSRPTLVFAHYQDSVEACARVASSLGASSSAVHGGRSKADNRRAVADFKAGRLDVLCASLEKLAEGVTLVQADMMILVERSFKPSRNEQATFRVHRLGQERPVTVRRYLTPMSCDARKERLLGKKTDQQARMMTAAEFASIL